MKSTIIRRLGLFIGMVVCLCISACSGPPPGSSNGTPATMAYMLGYGPNGGSPDRVVGYQLGSAASNNPVSTILLPSGSSPWGGLTTGPSHELYVMAFKTSGEILVYAAGATGTAAPSRVINLPYVPQSIFVDAGGNLYVACNNYAASASSSNIVVSVYAPDATGQAVPVRTFQSQTNEQPVDITVDSSGYIYVAGEPDIDTGNLPYSFIDVYSPDAEGSAEPIRSISFTVFISGLAVDGNGNVFASVPSSLNSSSGSSPTSIALEEFSPDANGYATPTQIIPLPAQSAGPLGGGTGGGLVRIDGAGNIYTPEVTGYTSEGMYGLYKISPGSNNPTVVIQSEPTSILYGFFALN